MTNHQILVAALADIPSTTLYALLKLRSDVFVVEQAAAYDDIDGRDGEPGALLMWAEDPAGAVISTARVLPEPGAMRIGRVATSVSARRQGIAKSVMERCLEVCGDATILLDGQAYLVDWYRRFGFEISGDEYLEDDIPHFPMRREPRAV